MDRSHRCHQAGLHELIAPVCRLFPARLHERIVLVGGCVRDMLRGVRWHDLDLAAALTPVEFESCGFRLVTGRSTVPVWFYHNESIGTVEAVALSSLAELADDLQRRDFTVNALALTLDGTLIDPLSGQRDLDRGVLMPCSPRSFANDPLRVVRAFRFESQGWQLAAESEGLLAARQWDDALQAVPVERMSRELQKALAAADPVRFFQRLLQYGIGRHWLPELFQMPQVPAGPLNYHPEGDLLTHTLQVLQRVADRSEDPLARFCAFCHDLGKLNTTPDCYPRHYNHAEAGFQPVQSLCSRLRLPSDWRVAAAWTCRLHTKANLMKELRPATLLKMAEQARKAGIVDILPLVSAADKEGQVVPVVWNQAVTVVAQTSVELGIDLVRLAALAPARRAGYLLQKRVERLQSLMEG